MIQKNHNRRSAHRDGSQEPKNLTFLEHAYELRRRLYYIGISIVIWGIAAYAVQQHIVSLLLRPSHGENFIYTTPGGGIDFLFRICIYAAIVFSLPVIVYNVLRFIEPLINRSSQRFIIWGATISGLLAVAGMIFGYFIGLPAALHFLSHQFTTVQIKPLVTIQSYLQFVIVYMVGSALLFQLPLMLILINRIKPLKPRRLLHYERWVILIAFIISGLMNPTPNLISQLFIAGPFIIMYQVGILLIALINRQKKADLLHLKDIEVQASRTARIPQLKPVPFDNSVNPVVTPRSFSAVRASKTPIVSASQQQSRPIRPRQTLYTNLVNQQPRMSDIRPVSGSSPLQTVDRLPNRSI